jgi:tRNA nucleotidyltransferase (CCA-adding enzyme)
MTTIAKLLALLDEFPKRKRVEFDNPDDRQFVAKVLVALKEAGPDLRAHYAEHPLVRAVTGKNENMSVDLGPEVDAQSPESAEDFAKREQQRLATVRKAAARRSRKTLP